MVLDSQMGPLIIATATFIGALVGSLTQFFIRRREQSERRNKVRKAIKNEVEAMEWLDREDAFGIGALPKTDIEGLISRQMYEAQAKDIGLLAEEEIEKIVTFYTFLSSTKVLILGYQEEWGSLHDADEKAKRDKIEAHLDNLHEMREELVSELDNRI
ncbi:hypothetical protein [Halostagnicola kamekurae]|uniref:Uncharacterized protein n=1 Tax=Halostagnicola kamekurae TaxID=619731 RepID=A0A1I6RMT1_9EURY|nr:hypothetical protein [Halostagnicola kamekurae]SFS66019.1 hypothetical protein SAMN04488556_1919 [Halostagnicola kamekurae]